MEELLVLFDVVDNNVVIIVEIDCDYISLAGADGKTRDSPGSFLQLERSLALTSFSIPDVNGRGFADLTSNNSLSVGTDVQTQDIIHVELRIVSHILGHHRRLRPSKHFHCVGFGVQNNTQSCHHVHCLPFVVVFPSQVIVGSTSSACSQTRDTHKRTLSQTPHPATQD